MPFTRQENPFAPRVKTDVGWKQQKQGERERERERETILMRAFDEVLDGKLRKKRLRVFEIKGMVLLKGEKSQVTCFESRKYFCIACVIHPVTF